MIRFILIASALMLGSCAQQQGIQKEQDKVCDFFKTCDTHIDGSIYE